MNSVIVAPGIRVIVRDWLNANQVLITGRDECVVIDSGYAAHARQTLALLARGRIAAADLPAYFERVPCYREYNARFFRLPAEALAAMVADDLLRSGAIVKRDGVFIPS